MLLVPNEKVGVFIDWENLRNSLEVLSRKSGAVVDMPWTETKRFFLEHTAWSRFHLYGAFDTGIADMQLKRKLSDLGFNLLFKKSQTVTIDQRNHRRKNADVELTVDVMSSFKAYDHIVIFSGDGDFTYLVEWLKRSGVRVTIISHFDPDSPKDNNASRVLMLEADTFLQLETFVDIVKGKI